MILNKEVMIGLSPNNIKHFQSLGYTIPKRKDNRGRISCPKGTKILVKVEHLMRSCKIKVLAKCEDCGNERKVSYDTLVNRENSSYNRSGETICSSCANHRMSGKNNSQYIHGNSLYPQYRNNARRRGLSFDLTVEQFEKLVPNKCHYCGDESKGIDRKDSDIGYVFENCVPCCSECNFIKNRTGYDDFIRKIKNMYDQLKKEGRSNMKFRCKKTGEVMEWGEICIDSNLLTAQDRKRYYWTNIPNVTQPQNQNLILKNILEVQVDEKYYYTQNFDFHGWDKKVIATLHVKGHDILKRVYNPNFKCGTLTACRGGYKQKKVYQNGRCRKLTPLEYERLQTVPEGYTEGVANSHRYNMLGDGWTVDVIAHILKNINT